MRTFVAVVPPESALAPLRELAAELRAEHPSLGWVAPERWHVTVRFLGDVPEERLARLEPLLAETAAAHHPLRLRVSGGGVFPRGDRPRVFWAGLAGDVEELAGLWSAAGEAARRARVPLDATPFRAHVTLARVRREGFEAGPALVGALGAARGPEWVASEVVLLRSHLGPRPRYEPIARLPLSG